MTLYDWAQYILFIFFFVWSAILLGKYMGKVFYSQARIPVLRTIETFTYRLCRIHSLEEMDGKTYALKLLGFNAIGFLFLFLILYFQHLLPLNPQNLPGLSASSAFNLAVSYLTNTNWQPFVPETTLSYFSHMVGLTVQNFLGAATGLCVLFVLIRGISPTKYENLGNVWVDLVRSIVYLLLPLALILSIFLVSQGVVQTLSPPVAIETLESREQTIPLGPVASQAAIKQLGSGGGGFFRASASHPFENPTPLSNVLELLAILLIPAAIPYMYGVMVGSHRQGWMLFTVMLTLWIIGGMISLWSENLVNPILGPGSAWEGKEIRIGISRSISWGVSTTATSNGSYNSMISSYSPLAGGVALLNMMLGETIFGGVGAGLGNMLMFLLLAVFLSGLMAGRTPEYLGKKIEKKEILWVILAVIFPSALILFGAALICAFPEVLAEAPHKGPHGFTEIVYTITSTTINNGSAFASFKANTPFYNVFFAVLMLLGRAAVMIPSFALATLLNRKMVTPPTAGMFRTDTFTFGFLLVSILLLMGGLIFFPALLLGPILEHLLMLKEQTWPF